MAVNFQSSRGSVFLQKERLVVAVYPTDDYILSLAADPIKVIDDKN